MQERCDTVRCSCVLLYAFGAGLMSHCSKNRNTSEHATTGRNLCTESVLAYIQGHMHRCELFSCCCAAFEHGTFIGLAVAYTTLAIIALVQLIRISQRVPEYGWTTQKVFHLLNLFVCILRAIAMAFRFQLQVCPRLKHACCPAISTVSLTDREFTISGSNFQLLDGKFVAI